MRRSFHTSFTVETLTLLVKRQGNRGTMSNRMQKIIGLWFVCIALGLFAWWKFFYPIYPEASVLQDKTYSFGELLAFFTKLAHTKGAVYAYEVLKMAELPPNTDMHLLGHVVGDELYKQKGIDGMSVCTQDFRNACSHAIVVGYFLAYGEDGLNDIAKACRAAPGGSGAYTMCFHGLGHGILAAVDYDLPKAVGLCEKTGFVESPQCVGGAIMEIVGGGFHNKTRWEKQSKKYLSNEYPLLPCTAEYMPQSARNQCFEYITPHLVKAAGGSFDTGIPSDAVLKKAFSFCTALPCFAGFGKEFIVLVHHRDSRTLADMPDEEMREVFRLCSLAGKNGELPCLTHALDSLYWGGENDPKAAKRFCEIMESTTLGEQCRAHLEGAMKFFAQ